MTTFEFDFNLQRFLAGDTYQDSMTEACMETILCQVRVSYETSLPSHDRQYIALDYDLSYVPAQEAQIQLRGHSPLCKG